MLRTRVRHAVVFCALLASVAACSSSTEPEGEGSLTGTWRGSVAGTKDGAGFTGSVTIRLTENAATGQTTGTAELSGLSGLFGEDATPNIQALAAPFRPGEVVMDLCNGGCEVTPEVDPKIMGLPRYFWERGSLRSVNEYP